MKKKATLIDEAVNCLEEKNTYESRSRIIEQAI